MKSISILRYYSDFLEDLQLGVTTRLMVTHDIPVTMVSLLETSPWIRKQQSRGDGEIFEGCEWRVSAYVPFVFVLVQL